MSQTMENRKGCWERQISIIGNATVLQVNLIHKIYRSEKAEASHLWPDSNGLNEVGIPERGTQSQRE